MTAAQDTPKISVIRDRNTLGKISVIDSINDKEN